MVSAWNYDFQQKLKEEVNKESMEIALGTCFPPQADASTIAMHYRERLGYLAGLRRALMVLEDLERGREQD